VTVNMLNIDFNELHVSRWPCWVFISAPRLGHNFDKLL